MQQRVIIWSLNEGVGIPLMEGLGGESAEFGTGPVALHHINGEHAELQEASVIALVVEYVDAQTLGIVRGAMGRLPRDRNLPMAFFVNRPEGKQDFKMSCPSCGQKLWIRDSDVGKKGRCPNCKKAFEIPEQIALLREQLRLPQSVEVRTVSPENSQPVRDVLEVLLRQAFTGEVAYNEAMKNQTSVIELDISDFEEVD